ncbi:MAG: glycosyltransferase family 2 protein [Phycisphaerae bacterium]|nr:glycosyltransferase family 2 protein [Phycisphaerae bacterium]
MTEPVDHPNPAADSNDRPALSVVAPCFNEEEVLSEFHRRMSTVCEQLTQSYEIVLVDDGSKDATWRLMNELAEHDPHLVLVKLSRNHGHQLALTAGLSVCRGGRVLIIDADLQDSPEHLPQMLEIMDRGADVVYGQRRHRAGESRFKLWTAAAFYRVLNRLSETPIPADTGDFRLISRPALDVLQAMPEQHRFIRGMVSWIGFRQEPFLFDRDARFAGETKYPFRKMFRLAMDALVSFSTWPLKLANILGLLAVLVGLLLLVWAVVAGLRSHAGAGRLAVLGVMALFSSVQLFVLGVLGAYLGRLYEQSKGRPLFIIETIRRA